MTSQPNDPDVQHDQTDLPADEQKPESDAPAESDSGGDTEPEEPPD